MHRMICGFFLLTMFTPAGVAGDRQPLQQKLYVTNSTGDSIHVIDLKTFKVLGAIKTGQHPHGAACSADGRWFFTTVESDHTLHVIDTATDRIVKTIKLTEKPNQCAATPDGRFVGVPIRGGDSVDIVDITQGKIVKNLPVKVPHNCYNAGRNDRLWVTSMGDHKVNLIDLKTLSYAAQIPVGGVPRPLAVTRDEKILYCALSDLHGFVIADIAKRKVIQTIDLPPLPKDIQLPVANTPTHGLELSPDEKELWVTSCATQSVYVFDTIGKKIVAKVGVGKGPNWVTFSPDGRYCCVSNVLGDDVSILDVSKRQEVARVAVGSKPKRLVVVNVARGKAEPYLTPDGKLRQVLEIRDVQGGFAGFTGKNWRITPDGEWTRARVFNQKLDIEAKGKLPRDKLAALAKDLAQYDLDGLKNFGKVGVNPHVVTIKWGNHQPALTLGAGQPLPKPALDSVPGRFSGIVAAVLGLVETKKKKETNRPFEPFLRKRLSQTNCQLPIANCQFLKIAIGFQIACNLQLAIGNLQLAMFDLP